MDFKGAARRFPRTKLIFRLNNDELEIFLDSAMTVKLAVPAAAEGNQCTRCHI